MRYTALAFLIAYAIIITLLHLATPCIYWPINEGDEGMEQGEIIEATTWRV